ncbi:MAG: choline dehydrogenase [Gammaproteobacteria bacterium]|nr:choline dehydrogenase [Gammaproteobacteria bacterium]
MVEYDYLIVGAGSAGCVLANRLSADRNNRVVLLEAGGGDKHPMLHIPAGWAANFNNPKVDWGYTTEPEPELNDRQLYWPRGKVLGGSSAINGMVYIRGAALDFEIWAQSGARGWSYEEVLPYFRKAEVQQTHDDEFHGGDGLLHVQDVRDTRSVHDAWIDAWVETGVPRNPDFNGAGQAGAGYYQFTQRNGRRWSTATAYLAPARSRSNLTVLTRVLVEKILFTGKRAVAVSLRSGNGQVQKLEARHIILSGGSVNSPQLLELSGIGDAERLARLDIPIVHHLPGVGENLQDHIYCPVIYGTHDEHSINREVQGWRLGAAALKWFFLRRGPLTTGSAPVGAFWYTRDGLEAPDIQVHFGSGATMYNAQGRIRALGVAAITAVVNQSRPESRGSLHIRSASPHVPPEIRGNYLSAEIDRRTLIDGMRILMNVFNQDALNPYVTTRMAPYPDNDDPTDEQILDYVREVGSTAYHPTCTCAMGDHAMSVVGPNLRVHGVQGLSVVDASVMPNVVSGNTNAATIMIAEKASDILLKEKAEQRTQA